MNMSPKANCWNRCSKRFDFGVPLEDVFPPNDIHPRLKYLFEEAYRVSLESGLTIDHILRQLQGSLNTRLKLKDKIIYDIHYHIKRENIDESPGAYFWTIRHFLGLLPIPLLPDYAKETQFDWNYLSERCHKFLRHYENERRRICQLDYEIAENLNLLPFEHFLLLFVMIIFLRKLSLKPTCRRQISRRTLVCLAKYFCSAIGSRPYRPGDNNKTEKIFPLFFYILLRWRYIEKNCRKIGHPAYFLETDCLNLNIYRGAAIRDTCVQTTSFLPEVITVYRNVPYICDNNNYLKDTGCQTETSTLIDKAIQNAEIDESSEHYVKVHEDEDGGNNNTILDTLNINLNDGTYEAFENVKPIVESSPVDIHPEPKAVLDKVFPLNINPIEIDGSVVSEQPSVAITAEDNDLVASEHELHKVVKTQKQEKDKSIDEDFSFLNRVDSINEWSDVLKETMKTVKRVEEYIYDDYETFSKEDYNQINDAKIADDSSLFKKISKIGWTYTPKDISNNAPSDDSKRESDETQIFSHYSYFKFDDVFEEDGSFKLNDLQSTISASPKNDSPNETLKNNHSKIPLCDKTLYSKKEKKTEEEPKSRRSFSLKRFKINLDFLRVMTPKKMIRQTPSYDSIGSNVKYKKIKNVKSTIF